MGKILDALKGKLANNTNTGTPAKQADATNGAVKLLRGIGALGLYAAVLLIPVVVLGALWFIGQTLYTSIVHLGTETLVVNPALARFTAFSMLTTLALLVVAGVALSRIGKRRTLLIAGLFALMWLAITVVLALVDTWLSAAQIEPDPTLLRIGVFVYSALPALPAIPLVALAYSAAHEQDGQYETIGAAAGALGFSLLKAFGAVAMFSIEAFFGISIGVNPIAAIFAALLNATAFIMALGSIQQAVHDNDHGGVRLWGSVSVFYAVVIFAIAAEAIITFSGGKDGALKAMNPPAILEWFAQWAFVSSIGLSALLIAVSFWRKANKQLTPAVSSDAQKVTIKPSLVHRAGMVAARPALLADEFKQGRAAAMGKTQPASLPAPLTLATDGVLNSDGWVYIPSWNGEVAEYEKQFPNNVKARIRNRADGVIATWVAWDDRSHTIFDQGSAEGVDGCKRDAEKAALAYVPSPLPPARQAAALNAVMVEAERLAGNGKVSPAGVPYSTTVDDPNAEARGYPTPADNEKNQSGDGGTRGK